MLYEKIGILLLICRVIDRGELCTRAHQKNHTKRYFCRGLNWCKVIPDVQIFP